MSKNTGYRKPYQNKAFFPKENYLSKEETKKLRNWLTVGYTGNNINSLEPFSKHKDIQTLIKKHPYAFKKIVNDNIKCVDNKIILFGLACVILSGTDGKHVLNDLFLKYVKSLNDLYFFVSYVKSLTNINNCLTPYITKYVRSQSFDKIHKEIIAYRNHETEISFAFFINKCGLKARNEKEQLYFNSITNSKGKCYIPIMEDFFNLKKHKHCVNLNSFSFNMLPDNISKEPEFAQYVVKNTHINTIFNNMKFFKEVDSIKYVSKTTTENVNKYLAAKAHKDCDLALKHIIKEKINSKKLKKKICNIIDYDLAGLKLNELSVKNIPFIFSSQFETSYNIIFENHERFREVEINIDDILNDNDTISVKLRENTTIYFDNFIGHLLEEEKKVDTFIVWSYGKEMTLKKRPQMMDVYNTYCDRDVKIVYIYFNENPIFSTDGNCLNVKGFDFNRTEEIIRRFIYGDI